MIKVEKNGANNAICKLARRRHCSLQQRHSVLSSWFSVLNIRILPFFTCSPAQCRSAISTSAFNQPNAFAWKDGEAISLSNMQIAGNTSISLLLWNHKQLNLKLCLQMHLGTGHYKNLRRLNHASNGQTNENRPRACKQTSKRACLSN